MKIHDSNRQVDLVKQDFAGCSFILDRERALALSKFRASKKCNFQLPGDQAAWQVIKSFSELPLASENQSHQKLEQALVGHVKLSAPGQPEMN